MVSMTVYVGSLKYSPVYKSHCCAFGKECEKQGYSVGYLLSREYEWMLSKEMKEKTMFIGNSVDIVSMMKDTLNFKHIEKIRRIFSEDNPSHVYMHNYHLLNHSIASMCRRYGSTFIQHVHEPYVENKKAHGGLHRYWLYAFEHFQGRLLQKTDIAVVSSKRASSLFDRRYPSFSGKRRLIPLMYEDLGSSVDNVRDRRYVTFVGPPVPAKGPQTFLEIVDYSNEKELDLSFLLISNSKVRSSEYYNKSNLKIFYKPRISDEEFGSLITKSFAVLTPYKRETQSSVILVSYMYGTPVVSFDTGGLSEFVFHKKTGYLIDKNAKIEEWIEAIIHMKSNLSEMSDNCRNYFVENFSEENWKKYLGDVLI